MWELISTAYQEPAADAKYGWGQRKFFDHTISYKSMTAVTPVHSISVLKNEILKQIKKQIAILRRNAKGDNSAPRM